MNILVKMITAEELRDLIISKLRHQTEELANIWNYMGYESSEYQERINRLADDFGNCFSQFIESENANLLKMNSDIENMRRDTTEMCRGLGHQPYFPERGLTTCQLLKDFRQKLDQLRQDAVKRRSDFANLRRNIIITSLQLGHDQSEIKKSLRDIPGLYFKEDEDVPPPTERDIGQMKSCLEHLKSAYEPMLCKFTNLKRDIQRLAKDVDYQPTSEKENLLLSETDMEGESLSENENGVFNDCENLDELIQKISSNLKGPAANESELQELSEWRLRLVKEKARLVGTCDELRAGLTSLWNRLDKSAADQTEFLTRSAGYKPASLKLLQDETNACQAKRLKSLEVYLPRLRDEAKALSQACFLEEQESLEMQKFEANDLRSAEYLEKRIEELNIIFNRNREIYECIAKYQNLWGELADLEIRMKDPAILSNRGGILLKSEKDKKRVQKEMLKAEQDAQSAINAYENNTGEKFKLGNGLSFKDLVDEQWMEMRGTQNVSARKGKRNSSAIGRRGTLNDSGPPGAPH